MKKADAEFSRRIRDRGVCQRCGRRPPEVRLQCAHIISRRYKAIRWDPMNALSLCYGCHHWGHVNPLEWEDWLDETFGPDLLETLKHKARYQIDTRPGRFSAAAWRELLAEIEQIGVRDGPRALR